MSNFSFWMKAIPFTRLAELTRISSSVKSTFPKAYLRVNFLGPPKNTGKFS